MNRRAIIGGLAAWAMTAPLPSIGWASTPNPGRTGSRLDALAGAIHPKLDLKNAHTGERLRVRFFSGSGYRHQKLKDANWFMRDWREKEERSVDIRLFWALAAIRQAARAEGHSGQIVFLSGYRTQKTNDMLRKKGLGAARNSFHLQARAVDFVIPGVPVAQVAKYMNWLQVGGIGHYRNNFIHIDTGPERTWNG